MHLPQRLQLRRRCTSAGGARSRSSRGRSRSREWRSTPLSDPVQTPVRRAEQSVDLDAPGDVTPLRLRHPHRRPPAVGWPAWRSPTRAISGLSSRSSSNGPRRRRKSSVGSIAVTDADRGAGASTASSPTTAPGPLSTIVRVPTCTRTLPAATMNIQSSTAPRSRMVMPGSTRTSSSSRATATSL